MRVVAVLYLFVAASLYADTSPVPHEAPLSLEELKQFSEHTTGGGGRLETFENAGHKIAVVMRCFTSGVRSTDFGVYAANREGRYYRVLYREPIWGSFLRPVQDGDIIRVVFDSGSTDPEKLAFTFTISGCFGWLDK